ncbi:helix-turn-helix domain-containing protein [Halomonas cupida]|uniref:helix-turn-helix domain-containing transcriptional regulator n=1 Tax=Halomonas cupida TaxID=44933 RepID=UPI0039B589C6
MNNFDMDGAATTLADSRSAHSLAREVLELRAERDKALVGEDAGQIMESLFVMVMDKGGITKLVAQTGLARGNLYRILSENGNPTLSTLLTILDALDLQLMISDKHVEGDA